MNLNATAEWWRPDTTRPPEITAGTEFTPTTNGDSPVAFRALMFFLFILLIAPQSTFPALAPFRLAMLAVLVALCAHVAGRFRQGVAVFSYPRETLISLCLLAWAILIIPLSIWPGGSVTYLLEFYIKTLMLFWLLGNIISTLPRLESMAWGLSLISVPVALTGLKNYLSGVYLAGGGERIDGYSAPLTANPNDLALMLNLLLPFTIAQLFYNKKPVVRIFLAAVIVLNVMTVFTTFSRAGFLTLTFILIAYTWILRKRPQRRWVYTILLAAVMVLPFVPSEYLARIDTITHIENDQTGSAQLRWSDMVVASRYVLTHPLTGAGIGMNIPAMDTERGAYGTAIHNVYLQIAVELGVPGLILFVLLLKTSINNVRTVHDKFMPGPATSSIYPLAEGIWISLLAFTVAAFFHPVAYHFYFYILAGLAGATRTIYQAGARSHF